MDLGAPVRPSSADTRPARGHWCVSEPEACWSFPFEPLPAPGDDAGEGEGSSDECVSATPLMSFSVITTQWIGPCHEPCVVKQWPAVFAARLSGDRQNHYCFVIIQYAGEEGWGIVHICAPQRGFDAATQEEKPLPLSPKIDRLKNLILDPTENYHTKC